MTYFDSSAIIKLYYTEPETERVSAFVRASSAPIAFSHLHALEVRNSLRLKVFRKDVSSRKLKASLDLIDADLNSGILLRPELNWFDVYRNAEVLSRSRAHVLGCRSLDLLHVASALILGAEDFLTFDTRQAVLAGKAGMNLISLS